MMRTSLVLPALLLALLPAQLFAKAATTRVSIEGSGFTINITDRNTLAQFNVWSGPGTFVNGNSSRERQSFIVDWSQGALAEAPPGLPRFRVSFYGTLPRHNSESLLYVVTYAFDARSGRGYVYVPGAADPDYKLDVRSILRGVEGRWFHAWRAWDEVAGPQIAVHLSALHAADGPTCFAIRRYLAKRVAPGSDSTYIAGVATCIPSSNVEVVAEPGRWHPSPPQH